MTAPAEDIMALLYARTSAAEQENDLHAQVERLVAEAERRGWEYEEPLLEHASGRTLARRPELRRALGWLERQRADVLMVTKLERLARSMADFGHLLERARRKGWELVVLDVGGETLDTTTEAGKVQARMLGAIAELERQLISDRTRKALGVVKAAGMQLGHPSIVPASVLERIVSERDDGLSWAHIASRLTHDGIPSPSGAERWSRSAVRRQFERATKEPE